MNMCDMISVYSADVWERRSESLEYLYTRDMAHMYAWYGSWICVTRLMNIALTYESVWERRSEGLEYPHENNLCER